MAFDSAGNLYGTASSGGSNNAGTVFVVPKGSGIVATVAAFDGADGSQPMSGITFDAAGNLYGTAEGGDRFGEGTVFEVTPAGVPEPSTMLLLGLGAVILAARQARRLKTRSGGDRRDNAIPPRRAAATRPVESGAAR